ncbi:MULTISPECIES: hydrolase [Methylomicrobium]|uniref:Putative hydrolase of the alpha/beta-hydrolase fold n=1 Tax=Methylomicrobium album BG8 TaxID=686340 RepID=H8GLN1_METAL|nr:MULTISPECIES: hydrolase [Methylomicrobium]EIC30558.1 putative hydrolase of the alpha/beta-hydrolase fold [Methylomicrobium album BG8]
MIIHSSFKPAWWLKNAHLQTIFPAFFRTTKPPRALRRERLTTPDNDFLDIDHCGETGQPIVILLHGLTGSSESGYIKGLQHALAKMGLRTVALNFRGCSGESNRLARCYHSGETEDIHFLYRILREREPETPMAAIGFSLGGNVLLKWLGEQGNRLDLFAAVAVSVPLVLSVCASKLDRGFSKIYRGNLLGELKRYVRLKLQHLETLGIEAEAEKIRQLGNLAEIDSFWQYDDIVVARLHGYRDVHDYYQRSSSRQFLKSIVVPTLVIQAADDPFMTLEVLPEERELSPSVHLEIARNGGHVGFVTGAYPFRPRYWLEQRIPEFLALHLDKNLAGRA